MKFILLLFLIVSVNARLPSQDNLARSEDDPFTLEDCVSPIELLAYVCEWPPSKYDAWRWDANGAASGCVKEEAHKGCSPTKNNFKSYEECLDIAGPVCGLRK
ncbi:uncharacterized protein LOC114329247 [Diabrotica virgifera virgifera]|uniref:Uncharacterized protein n=1 Tax=Diabrotica virgifera virgifera TaxID=50390 RepID=A0ABM5IJ88_DIAVI|nr:uncharacterized protein LOC114329247 [Diabrotica virgifera virgifera]